MGPATKKIDLDGRLPMHRAGYIESPTMAYETWGELNDKRSNAILIFSGLSPSAHAASSAEDPSDGWWQDMIGPGLPLDSNSYYIICVNSLGSCFGSTGPASIDPQTGEMYRLTFPVLTLEDVAEAAYRVVLELGIEQLHTVIGCSMGGMSGLAFCVNHPGATRNFISISSATRAEPFSIAVRSLQREIGPEMAGRPLRRRRSTHYRPAARAQARHDDLPLARGVGAAIRQAAHDSN